jgi:hypothetical protein
VLTKILIHREEERSMCVNKYSSNKKEVFGIIIEFY